MPLISVIIPTFNRAELLRKAINSVLSQVGGDFEVIVSDNCSEDHTAQVAAEFLTDKRLVYSRNDSNLGMVGNWRRAIYELAQGDWFILMSDDDYLTDMDYLSTVCEVIRTHAPAFIYAGGEVHDTTTGTVEVVKLPFDGLVPGAHVFASRGTMQPQDALLPTMVFRRADAQRLGFLSDPDNLSCDSELYLKLCAEGQVFAVARSACVYLKHGANLIYTIATTRNLLDHNLDYLVNPYFHARERGMEQRYLDAFRRNTNLDRAISATLLRLWLHNPAWHAQCRARIVQKLPDLVAEIESSFKHQARRALIILLRPILRRRYPVRSGEMATP